MDEERQGTMRTVNGWESKEPIESELVANLGVTFAAKRCIEDGKMLKIMAWRSRRRQPHKIRVMVALYDEVSSEATAELPNGPILTRPATLLPGSAELAIDNVESRVEEARTVDEALARYVKPYLAGIVAIRDALERGETP